ncbi:hypothetical protein [Thiobacillus sp.]|uniref:hypothetical protein n=1 Tax=Thiobacillus sp. TaxID=924 RepID=UPI0011D4F2AB|nr:hypothetical protein [Thiobacillus sp.]TXH72844.1 MAG: hypothetical protein E6Q82_15735 [Thiobacillus sp.]
MTQFVYVIESPADADLLDGRTEGKSLCEAFQLADIPYSYSLVTTPKTLEESLGPRLIKALSHFNQPPILHLSMHGNDEGVALTNGEFLTWANLRKLLTPLTNTMEGGLLICMSSCFGSSGCRMAMHEDTDHPFWALVGNSQTALWSDAAVAYITFYHLFFKGVSVEQCLERMRSASGDNNFMVFSGLSIKANWASFMEGSRRASMVQALRNYSSTVGTSGGLLNIGNNP